MNAGIFGVASGLKEARRGKVLGLQPIWESPDAGNIVYVGAFVQWNHGLGITPKFWKIVFKNLVAEGGWTPGYELDVSCLWSFAGTAGIQGAQMVQYANNQLIGFQAYNALDAQFPVAWNSSANGSFSFTAANWRPLARIYG